MRKLFSVLLVSFVLTSCSLAPDTVTFENVDHPENEDPFTCMGTAANTHFPDVCHDEIRTSEGFVCIRTWIQEEKSNSIAISCNYS